MAVSKRGMMAARLSISSLVRMLLGSACHIGSADIKSRLSRFSVSFLFPFSSLSLACFSCLLSHSQHSQL